MSTHSRAPLTEIESLSGYMTGMISQQTILIRFWVHIVTYIFKVQKLLHFSCQNCE